MTAKECLTRYRDAVRESREIELKITQLRLRYGAPGAINYSDMPKAHNNSDLSDYAEKLDELTTLLYGKYEKCLGIMVDVEMRLDRMDAGPNTQIEREILRHRYTDITDQGRLASWDSVSAAVGYSRRQVERFHGSALQHFPTD
jgi:hypothetical protein